jgi:hypothetical protein
VTVALMAVCSVVSCTARRGTDTLPEFPVVGYYKVRLTPSEGRARRFRMLLFAERPDRIQGEIFTPVGSTALIFDGGGGRLSVALVGEGRAFVGDEEADSLERLFGLRMTLEELVGAVLTGRVPDGEVTLRRDPATSEGLPRSLEVTSGHNMLTMELRRSQALGADRSNLGTGQPPEGLELSPLTELQLVEIPGSQADGDPR